MQWEKYKWTPKLDEKYWYVTSWGEVGCRHYTASGIDKDFLPVGNAFSTEEQAQKAAEKLKELFKSL